MRIAANEKAVKHKSVPFFAATLVQIEQYMGLATKEQAN